MGDCGLALAMRQLAGRRAAVLVSFQSERVWSFDGADLDTIAFEERRSRCVVRGSVERCLTPGFGQYQRPDLCCSRGRAAVSRREPVDCWSSSQVSATAVSERTSVFQESGSAASVG